MRGYMLNRLDRSMEAIAELANFKPELKKVSSSDSILEVRYLYNYRLATAYLDMDSFNLALNYINRSIKLLPKYQWSYIIRINILKKLKRFDLAKNDLIFLENDLPIIFDINYYWGIYYIDQQNY